MGYMYGAKPKTVKRAKYVRSKPKPKAKTYSVARLAPERVFTQRSLNVLSRPPVLSIKHRSKLLYNDNRTITATSAASNAYVFSANGLYDPDITSGITGHQPMGFDQLMLLYEHYTVTNARITVSFVNESAAENAYVGIALFPDSSVETVPTKMIENGLLKREWLAPNNGTAKSQCSVVHECKIAKLNGRPGNIVGDDLYRGDSASNPTEQSYFHVFAYNIATANSITVRFDVLIEYDAVFTEPRKLVQS